MDITAKLAELGLELPKAAAPVAAYVPVVEHGGLLYVSGQLPFRDGQVVTGRLGDDMVNSAPSFTDQAKVANGASDLFETLFGDAGRHARAAVGVAVLPLGAAVEADAIVAVRPA